MNETLSWCRLEDRIANEEAMNQFKGVKAVMKRLLIFAMLVSCLLTTGCKGCFDDSAKKKKPEEEKAKENFENLTPVTLPGFYPPDPKEKEKLEKEAKDDETKRELLNRMDPAFRFNKTKLGHWVSIDFIAIANNFNAEGYLETGSSRVNRPNLIEGTDYFVETVRPFTLTKGEWKKLETSVFLPRKAQPSKTNSISYVLNNGGSIPALNPVMPVNLLEDYQFHIVLLSTRSDSLKYLSFLDCIRLPSGDSGSVGTEPEFYSIVPTTKDNPVPLPNQSLNWTTIAYLIWDDLDPDALSRQQQQALLDWLHFGGQIIFSGPDCIDRLQSSFLADYLPGQFEESIALNKADLAELNENWSIESEKNPAEKRKLIVVEDSPLPAIRFRPHEDADFIEGSSGLAIERRIGRGRVVATAFSINNRQMKNWRSFSSFVHNALLRKPARRFAKSQEFASLSFKYSNDRTTIYDPLTGSTLRFISRDLASTPKAANIAHSEETQEDYENANLVQRSLMDGMGAFGARSEFILPGTGRKRNTDDVFHYGGFHSASQSGVAGWNDDSGIAMAARETLKKAARISPPSASFVMKMLGLYLLILVPINWAIFRLIGKVEWAWIAAPIIALTGAFAVVRYASLDIGFVRSVTHVGVLELHNDYPRGHLTDYAALYTSLSTRYNVELDNLSGQSLPFANVSTEIFRRGESSKRVELNRTTTTDLKNYLVRSNSTGLLHTEMILDVGGGIRLLGTDDSLSVENGSLINIEDAGVVRRNNEGELEFAWLGSLEAGSEQGLDFVLLDGSIEDGWAKVDALVGDAKTVDEIWRSEDFDENSVPLDSLARVPGLAPDWPKISEVLDDKMRSLSRETVSKSMLASALSQIDGSGASLASVFECVASSLQVGKNEVRLIGRTDQQLDQTRYQPSATQAKHNLLVLVHLQHAELLSCKKDENAVSDFVRGRSNIDQEDDEFLDSLVEPEVVEPTEEESGESPDNND